MVGTMQNYKTTKLPGFYKLSFEDRLSRLGLESLLHRRVKTDLVMCYKILHNHVHFDCVNFFSAPHFLIPDKML